MKLMQYYLSKLR